MTSASQDHLSEQELERNLEEIRSNWSRQEKAEPPELLNQAVLNRARRELESRVKTTGGRRSLKWLGAFATVSVAIIALTLIIQQENLAPVPAAGEADGLRLDHDASRAVREAQPMEAPQVRSKREQPRQESFQDSAGGAARLAKMKTAEVAEAVDDDAGAVPLAEDWIAQMVQLKESGQKALLTEQLAAFRAAYPDYPLPSGLED